MIKKETIKTVIPAQEISKEKVVTQCDICDKEVNWKIDDSKGNWGEEYSHEIDFVVMKHRKGDCFYIDVDVTETEFDICPKCWEEHILPLMKSLGAKPREEEKDY